MRRAKFTKLLEASFNVPYEPNTPPHLAATSWVDFEFQTTQSNYELLSKELSALLKKPTAKRVHDARIALRLFFSVWQVLDRDGWASKKADKKVLKPLQKLLKTLGSLRDWDVNVEIGQKVKVSQALIKEWKKEQATERKLLRKFLKTHDIAAVLSKMEAYLFKRYRKLRANLLASNHAADSAYRHLDVYLREHEKQTQQLAKTAKTIDELHQLRLAVKSWRFCLAEYFGLTSLALYKSQQCLGRIHDYARISDLLKETTELKAIKNLDEMSSVSFEEFSKYRKLLPYGLRPQVITAEQKV